MSSSSTIKTTVRLPADLHWQFQGERAKRRLSNEKAIAEAFALWIAQPQQLVRRPSKNSRSRLNPPTPHGRNEDVASRRGSWRARRSKVAAEWSEVSGRRL